MRRLWCLSIAGLSRLLVLLTFGMLLLSMVRFFISKSPTLPIQVADRSRDTVIGEMKGNPVYRGFNLTYSFEPAIVDLLIIVSSAKEHLERRQIIRATWLTWCKPNSKITVKCIFMTETSPEVKREMQQNPDILVQPLRGGVEFGRRYLYHIAWAVANYDFHYLLRVDDDYFLCLDRLLHEIPMSPPLKNFHWGYTHCLEGLVRPEESLVMFSSDLIYRFLSQDPNEMLCHPWADQQISLWLMNLHINGIYITDPRLHHDPPVSNIMNRLSSGNICYHFIGLHGVYPMQMKQLWDMRGSAPPYQIPMLDFFRPCVLDHYLDWTLFGAEWLYQPKLCITHPHWDTSHQSKGNFYGGREELFFSLQIKKTTGNKDDHQTGVEPSWRFQSMDTKGIQDNAPVLDNEGDTR